MSSHANPDVGSLSTEYAAGRLYYLDGLHQAEVARRLGVSRPTVSRLLARAREHRIVSIDVRPPTEADELASALAEALGLPSAVVAPPAARSGETSAVGHLASRALGGLGLRPGDVLALGWGQTIAGVVRAPRIALPGVIVVPAVGGMNEREEHFQLNELVRRLAVASDARPAFLHAPALPSPQLHASLLADEEIRSVLTLWDRVDCAVVGIGAPPSVLGDYGPAHALRTSHALTHAVGDICSRYFDADGTPIPYPGEDRLLALTRDQLVAARTVIGVAAGGAKVASILGAARAKLIDVLVTEATTARALLAAAQPR
jgi:DNA-binding transcriptional regulator LsrR (DeoR family)